MTNRHVIIILLFFIFSCETEISLDSINNEQVLVVDGSITNMPGIYTVKLSLSSNINEPLMIPYENCKIIIFNNTDFSEILTETAPGIYNTSETGIQGEIGKQYKITIETPEGKKYETEFQTMLEPIGIDTVYAEIIYKETLDYPAGLPGYKFYVDTETAPNLENYYMWNMSETYEYTGDYTLDAIYDGNTILINGLDTITKYDDLFRCWKTQNIKNIFTGKTSNLSVPKISNKPLHFVSTKTRQLSIKYSLLLTQNTINKKAYKYWKEIENQISDDNILFATQPYNVIGNVLNKKNPEELVYGYFTVSSVSKKRIFLERPAVPFHYSTCFVQTDNIFSFPPAPAPYYLTIINGEYGKLSESCFDCTTKGGIPERPNFW